MRPAQPEHGNCRIQAGALQTGHGIAPLATDSIHPFITTTSPASGTRSPVVAVRLDRRPGDAGMHNPDDGALSMPGCCNTCHDASRSTRTRRPSAVAMLTSASSEKRGTRPRSRSFTRGAVTGQFRAASACVHPCCFTKAAICRINSSALAGSPPVPACPQSRPRRSCKSPASSFPTSRQQRKPLPGVSLSRREVARVFLWKACRT